MTIGQDIVGNANVQIANLTNSTISVSYQATTSELPLEPAEFVHGGILSPSQILRPRYAVVPFDDYTRHVEELERWCTDPGDSFQIRIVCGPGGAGKTRLAVELCQRMALSNWITGFFRRPTPTHPIDSGQLDALGRLPTARLIVVDYAEALAQDLGDLLRQISIASSQAEPVRILLLARGAVRSSREALASFKNRDDWFDLHLQEDIVTFLLETEPDGDDVSWRERIFVAARNEFAKYLLSQGGTTAVDLTEPTFDRPLMIAIAAYLDAAQGILDHEPIPRYSDDLLDDLLRHEDHYWERSLEATGQAPTSADLRKRVAALATLMGSDSEEEGARLLTLVPDLVDATAERRHSLARWIASCYPGQHYWNRIEPDLIGERLVASVYGESQDVLRAALGARAPEPLALTSEFLGRACSDNREALSAPLREVLVERLLPLVRIAVDQAGEPNSVSETPLGPSLAGLLRAVMPEGPVLLEAIALLPPSHRNLVDLRHALWSAIVADTDRRLGPDHPLVLGARRSLATSYFEAGKTSEAIELQELIVRDMERINGNDDLETVRARGILAVHYKTEGRISEAIEIELGMIEVFERTRGVDEADIVAARSNLASSYDMTGRIEESLALREQALLDRERIFGENHLETIRSRANLALTYSRLGRIEEAIEILEDVVTKRESQLGSDHPDTNVARGSLAGNYQKVGRIDEAIALQELVVENSARLLGPDHPNALRDRANLATAYFAANRETEALNLFERVLADRERLLPADHPDTISAMSSLEYAFRTMGRSAEAVAIGRRLLAGRERLLGVDHEDTMGARASPSISLYTLGNVAETIEVLTVVVADHERVLGHDHFRTVGLRDLLRNISQ